MAIQIERLAVDLIANSAQFNRSLASSQAQSDRWAKQVQGDVKRTAAAFAGSLIAGAGLRQITQYADAYTNVENKIRQVTDTQIAFAAANSSVLDIAIETRSNIEAVATLYARTARQADKLGLSQRDVADFTLAVNQALQSYGATAQEASSATLQLSQALGSGRLAGEEFRAVNEAAPPIIDAVAKALGRESGEMKELAKQGKITADVLVASVLAQKEAFANDFGQVIATNAANLQTAATNLTEFVGKNEALNATLQAGSQSLVTLSENLGAISTVATVAGVALGARLLGPLAATGAAMAASAASTVGTTLAFNVYTAATIRAGVATTALATASRLGAVSMAALGGPAGLLILGSYAAFQFATSNTEAADALAEMRKQAGDAAAAVEGLTQAQVDNSSQELVGELRDVEAQLVALKEKSDELNNGVTFLDGLNPARIRVAGAEIEQEFNELNKKKDALRTELEALFNRSQSLTSEANAAGADGGGADGTNEDLAKTIERLQRQVTLYGDVSAAAKLRYEIEKGAFEGAGIEQRTAALDLAAALDQKRADEAAAKQATRDAEEEARLVVQNERVVSLQQAKFDRIAQAALESTGNDRQIENARFEAANASLEADLERLRAADLLTGELKRQFYDAEQNQKAIHEKKLTDIEVAAAKERQEAEEEVQAAKRKLLTEGLGALAAAFKEGSAIQRAALVAQRLIALDAARVSLGKSIAKANELGFPANIGAIAQATATGLSAISLIKGIAHGGLENVPSEGTYFLNKDERVLSPNQNADLTKALKGGGGMGNLQVILNTQSGNNFDVQRSMADGQSRLVITEIVDSHLASELNSGRGTFRAMEQAYGLKRAGTS